MKIELHITAPRGDALRQMLLSAINIVKNNNRMLINAMLRSGQDVPDTVYELGLTYVPNSQASEPGTQVVKGYAAMLETGSFSCDSASAWEAAVLEEKYGVPAVILLSEQNDTGLLHAVYMTSSGAFDPVQQWRQQQRGRDNHISEAISRSMGDVESVGQCEIGGDGVMSCTSRETENSCILQSNGQWLCPQGHPAHGSKADVRGVVWTREGRGYAEVGERRVRVPYRSV